MIVPNHLQMPRPRPNLHEAIYSEDQWQGRARHPDGPSRMGIRSRLPELRSTFSRIGRLAPSLQLASPTW